MSTCADPPTKSRDPPENYRAVDGFGDCRIWEHTRTGLRVELFRYARFYDKHDPTPDFWEHRLVIRDGTDSEAVDSTTTNYGEGGTDGEPVGMAREWMRAHPDGEWEGA